MARRVAFVGSGGCADFGVVHCEYADSCFRMIGPILTGVPLPIQICSTNSTVNDILNMAAIAAGRLGQVK